jgi:hypothetical protein
MVLHQRQRLQAALDRLPVCLCHHNAFRRNLLARGTAAGAQTVAIEWYMVGYGSVGEKTRIPTAMNLLFLEVAGWRGDARLTRFGYTASATRRALHWRPAWHWPSNRRRRCRRPRALR